MTQEEADRLRLYLLKGGYLWVDDFWGTAAWAQWSREIAKALPPSEYPIRDIPLDDPILQSQFVITTVPQITNIGFWRRSGGSETSERGADSDQVHFRAIRDKAGRIMVVMTHNTDVADSWEREGEDPAFFEQARLEASSLRGCRRRPRSPSGTRIPPIGFARRSRTPFCSS